MKNIKPSELIKLALSDLEKVENMPDIYEVDMSKWHEPVLGKCKVCLAGSFIAMTFHTNPKITKHNFSFDSEIKRFLSALNQFRLGEIFEGLSDMKIINTTNIEHFNITPYEIDKIKFKSDMLEMVKLLETHNL